MMQRISAASARFAGLVVAVVAGIVVLGLVHLRTAPVDSYPEYLPPLVQIRTEALGLSATEVEQLVTVPLEQDLLNGVPWLDQIRSESRPGLSAVDLVFEPGTDVLDARQMVQERLAQVAGLPNIGSRPVMLQPLSSTSRVLMMSLASRDLSLIDLSVLARWKIRPRLLGIPGVANVAIWGQRDRQLQVKVDPAKLAANGVSLTRVIDSTGNALWSSPLTFVEASTPGTGGFIDTTNQRLGVQHMMPITTPGQLGAVTIEDTAGKTLRLRDVATVVEDHQPLIGDAAGRNGPSLMLVVQKFPHADTAAVTRDVEATMRALGPGLSGVTVDTTVYRPAGYLETTRHNLALGAGIALGLVLLVLALFTRSWRVTVVAGAAVGASVVTAALVLLLRGTPLSSITVAGLAVALSVVVGDAVLDTLAMRSRAGRWQRRGGSVPLGDELAEGSHMVRRPMLYALLVLLVLVVPLLGQGGVSGAFTREFAVSYGLALLASTAVALTLTPALASWLWRSGREPEAPGAVARASRTAYDGVAPRFVGDRRLVLGTVAALAAIALTAVPQVRGGGDLLPTPRERNLVVQLRAVQGTSLQEMDRITAAVGGELEALDGVRGVGTHVGRAVGSDQLTDVDSAELWFTVARSADYDATLASVREVVGGYPGLSGAVTTYEQEQLASARAGSPRPLVVRVFGHDLLTLRTQADRVRHAVAGVEGVRGARVETQPEQPTIQVQVDLAKAERLGIRPGDVRREAATLLSGLLVGNLYEQQKIFDVVVWGDASVRQNLSSVQGLIIDTPSGRQVRLGDVATVRMAPSPASILHQDVGRYLDVTANLSGRSLSSVQRDVTARIQALHYPLEYHAEVVPTARQDDGVSGLVLGLAAAALVGAVLLLQALYGRWRTALLVMALVPLGLSGSIAVAPLTGGLWSAGALMAVLCVFGVGLRNAIVVVAAIEARTSRGVPASQAVLDGTRGVLEPVLLTTVALAVAFTPFLVLGDTAGIEILHVVAAVVLAGLVTSTLLTLFVLPAVAARVLPSRAWPGPSVPHQPSRPPADEDLRVVEEVHHEAP